MTYVPHLKDGKWVEKEDDPKSLAYVEQVEEDEFIIKPVNTTSSISNRLWQIVRGSYYEPKQVGYIIKPKDIIKIGRISLRVREIVTDNVESLASIDEEFQDWVKLEEEPENEGLCKFCWVGEETEDNPKLCPCSCTGSMRYIHINWLRHWIDSRKQSKGENGVTSIIWKNFDCEICKKPYPSLFEYKGK